MAFEADRAFARTVMIGDTEGRILETLMCLMLASPKYTPVKWLPEVPAMLIHENIKIATESKVTTDKVKIFLFIFIFFIYFFSLEEYFNLG